MSSRLLLDVLTVILSSFYQSLLEYAPKLATRRGGAMNFIFNPNTHSTFEATVMFILAIKRIATQEFTLRNTKFVFEILHAATQ